MGISDMIARFINEVLEGENGCCELQRSELANRFGCVPSQINSSSPLFFSRTRHQQKVAGAETAISVSARLLMPDA